MNDIERKQQLQARHEALDGLIDYLGTIDARVAVLGRHPNGENLSCDSVLRSLQEVLMIARSLRVGQRVQHSEQQLRDYRCPRCPHLASFPEAVMCYGLPTDRHAPVAMVPVHGLKARINGEALTVSNRTSPEERFGEQARAFAVQAEAARSVDLPAKERCHHWCPPEACHPCEAEDDTEDGLSVRHREEKPR